jgi:hypothetical protein
MRKPKPTTAKDTQLTKAGKPRLRAPGAGAPDKGRKTYLSRVSAQCLADFQTIAKAIAAPGKAPSLADAIEHAARTLAKQIRPKM